MAVNLGCFPRSLPLAFAIAIPSRVLMRIRSASNSATMPRTLKKQPAHGIGGIVDRTARAQGDALPCQLVSDITGVWKRPRQAVELGDDKSVTGTHRGHCFAESGPGPVGVGKAVVNMDVLKGDTEGSMGARSAPICISHTIHY